MSKDQIKDQFGAHAASYAASEVHAKGASLAKLVELVAPQPGWRVLDVATGAGHTAAAFAPLVAEVIATDITPEMLEQTVKLARERNLPNIITETADAEALSYEAASFDLVTCRIAPHHFANIPAFLAGAYRVLRPAGILAVVDNIVPPGPVGDYVNAFEKLRDPSHGRCWSISEWQEAFASAGFALINQQEMDKTIDFDFWAKRHGADVKAYLKALLSEASGSAAGFLQPQISRNGCRFNLKEGLFICRAGK